MTNRKLYKIIQDLFLHDKAGCFVDTYLNFIEECCPEDKVKEFHKGYGRYRVLMRMAYVAGYKRAKRESDKPKNVAFLRVNPIIYSKK